MTLLLPSFLRPIFCITVHNDKCKAFLERLGPVWSLNVLKWSGTKEIDKRAWLLKEKITPYCRLTTDQLTCFDSHRQVWKNCIRSKLPMFVVEDGANIVCSDAFVETMNLFWKRIEESNEPWDFLYIGHSNRHKPKRYVTNFVDSPNVVVPSGCQGLFAYLVTPKGAQFLVDRATPYDRPADVFVQHCAEKDPEFKCLAVYPSPFNTI